MRSNFLKITLMVVGRGLELERYVFDLIKFQLLCLWGLGLGRYCVHTVISRNLIEHLFVDRTGPVEDLGWVANTVNRRLCIDQRGDVRYETCLVVGVHGVKLGCDH